VFGIQPELDFRADPGIFVAYMVLATQYNSFIHPVTILLALPFSAREPSSLCAWRIRV